MTRKAEMSSFESDQNKGIFLHMALKFFNMQDDHTYFNLKGKNMFQLLIIR